MKELGEFLKDISPIVFIVLINLVLVRLRKKAKVRSQLKMESAPISFDMIEEPIEKESLQVDQEEDILPELPPLMEEPSLVLPKLEEPSIVKASEDHKELNPWQERFIYHEILSPPVSLRDHASRSEHI